MVCAAFDNDPMQNILEESSLQQLRIFLKAASSKYFPEVPNAPDVEIVDDPNPARLNRNVIQISRNVILDKKICRILILHELIHHALLETTGDPDANEGAPFQAEVERLWVLGAYKGLL